ncbi:hypothetical protein RCL1_004709 [Eukaryota sp. TZLM3-RCL]
MQATPTTTDTSLSFLSELFNFKTTSFVKQVIINQHFSTSSRLKTLSDSQLGSILAVLKPHLKLSSTTDINLQIATKIVLKIAQFRTQYLKDSTPWLIETLSEILDKTLDETSMCHVIMTSFYLENQTLYSQISSIFLSQSSLPSFSVYRVILPNLDLITNTNNISQILESVKLLFTAKLFPFNHLFTPIKKIATKFPNLAIDFLCFLLYNTNAHDFSLFSKDFYLCIKVLSNCFISMSHHLSRHQSFLIEPTLNDEKLTFNSMVLTFILDHLSSRNLLTCFSFSAKTLVLFLKTLVENLKFEYDAVDGFCGPDMASVNNSLEFLREFKCLLLLTYACQFSTQNFDEYTHLFQISSLNFQDLLLSLINCCIDFAFSSLVKFSENCLPNGYSSFLCSARALLLSPIFKISTIILDSSDHVDLFKKIFIQEIKCSDRRYCGQCLNHFIKILMKFSDFFKYNEDPGLLRTLYSRLLKSPHGATHKISEVLIEAGFQTNQIFKFSDLSLDPKISILIHSTKQLSFIQSAQYFLDLIEQSNLIASQLSRVVGADDYSTLFSIASLLISSFNPFSPIYVRLNKAKQANLLLISKYNEIPVHFHFVSSFIKLVTNLLSCLYALSLSLAPSEDIIKKLKDTAHHAKLLSRLRHWGSQHTTISLLTIHDMVVELMDQISRPMSLFEFDQLIKSASSLVSNFPAGFWSFEPCLSVSIEGSRTHGVVKFIVKGIKSGRQPFLRVLTRFNSEYHQTSSFLTPNKEGFAVFQTGIPLFFGSSVITKNRFGARTIKVSAYLVDSKNKQCSEEVVLDLP